jgi:signal peptidase complex subunit 1
LRSAHFLAMHSPLQIIAFFVGYFTQDIRLSLYVGLAGTVLTFLAVVPPWPFYNKNPEGWLPASNAKQAFNIDVDGQKVG